MVILHTFGFVFLQLIEWTLVFLLGSKVGSGNKYNLLVLKHYDISRYYQDIHMCVYACGGIHVYVCMSLYTLVFKRTL